MIHTINQELVVRLRRDLHRIPEASFKEFKTIRYIASFLEKRGVAFKQVTETAIVAFIKGRESACKIGIRADIDALEITEDTGFDFASEHQGFMHACGHDFHTAHLLGLIDYYMNEQPATDLICIFQPAEEGAGGAKYIIEQGLYNHYGKPDYIFGYHVKPDLETGFISAAKGRAWAGTLSFQLAFKGRGGHAANPHETSDLMMVFSQWYAHMQGFISRKMNAQSTQVLTVGLLEGANRLNIIPSKIKVEGMLRYFEHEEKEQVLQQMKESAMMFAKLYGAQTEFQVIRDAIPLVNDALLLESIEQNYQEIINKDFKEKKLPKLVREEPVMLAEDFPEYLKDTRGIFFFLGAKKGENQQLHTPTLDLNEEALIYGMQFMKHLIENYKAWVAD